MTSPLCTKKGCEGCFARCGKNKDHCSILREMTLDEDCCFYKSETQYVSDAKKYPPRIDLRIR